MHDKEFNLGVRIRDYRQANGLTQRALANKLGIGYSRLSNWENGTNCPDADMIRQICLALSISPSDLLDIHITDRVITGKDYKMIEAYHAKKEVQYAVDTLLGLVEDA